MCDLCGRHDSTPKVCAILSETRFHCCEIGFTQ